MPNGRSPGAIVRSLAREQAESVKPVDKIFVERHLARAFQASGYSLSESEEKADEWAPTFESFLEESLQLVWLSEGVNPPLEKAVDTPGLFLGPCNSNYTGEFNENCFAVLDLVLNTDERTLNFVAACTLAVLGASKIFVVDGARDGGVDVIGCWTSGASRGLCACVQVKAWSGRLAAQHVEDAMTKFLVGRGKRVWENYRSYIGAGHLPGVGHVFALLSRDGFQSNGFDAGRKLGALCWGPRKVALTLGSYMSAETFDRILRDLGEMPRNPRKNLFDDILLRREVDSKKAELRP